MNNLIYKGGSGIVLFVCLVVLGGRKLISISFTYVVFEILEKIFNWKFLVDNWNFGNRV